MSDYPFPWGPPPPGYVPGLGRGETGFVSYIENSVIEIQDDKSELSRLNPAKIKKQEKEDDAADDFYKQLEQKISSRNKKKKKTHSLSDGDQTKTIFDEVRDQFADLSHSLKKINSNDWENIPDIGATKNYRPKWELLTYASDRMVTGDFSQSALSKEDQIQNQKGENEYENDQEMLSINRAKTSVMKTVLSKQIQKSTFIDTSQYQESLNRDMEERLDHFAYLEQASSLYKKMTKYNKEDPTNWILRARIEERLGNYEKARKVAIEGLSYNRYSEDMILEAVRLSSQNDKLAILEAALNENMRKSEKLWMEYAAHQPDDLSTFAVLERALNEIPDKPNIWIAACDYNKDDAIQILLEGLKFNPHNDKIIIKGFSFCQNEKEINKFAGEMDKPNYLVLLSKAKAEEKLEIEQNIENTIKEAIQCSPQEKDWIIEAQKCERDEFNLIPYFIIENIPFSMSFLEQAKEANKNSCYIVTEQLLKRFAETTNEWIEYLTFLKKKGTIQEVINKVLDEKINNPKTVQQIAQFLDDESACSVLKFALTKVPHSPLLALEYANRLAKSGNIEESINFSKEQSLKLHSLDLYSLYESLLLSHETSKENIIFAYKKGIEMFPSDPNMWLRLASLQEGKEKGKTLEQAVRKCPNVGQLHIELIRVAKKQGFMPQQIRSLFEKACQQCKTDEIVWLFASENENSQENKISLLESAKKFVKRPEIIWARQIELLPVEQQLVQCNLAIEVVGQKPELLLLKAICHWRLTEFENTKNLLVKINNEFSQWGDGWAYRFLFEYQHGLEQDIQEFHDLFSEVTIKNGFLWEAARSDPEFLSLDDFSLLQKIAEQLQDPTLDESSMFGHLLTL